MQCQFSLLYRENERELIPYCQDQGIAVTCFSPLARGWLSGAKHHERSKSDIWFGRWFGDALDIEICNQVETIVKQRSITMAEVALAWVISKDFICCPLLGADSPDHIENNVKALDLKLSNDEIETLDNLYRPRDVLNDYVPSPMPRHLGGVLSSE